MFESQSACSPEHAFSPYNSIWTVASVPAIRMLPVTTRMRNMLSWWLSWHLKGQPARTSTPSLTQARGPLEGASTEGVPPLEGASTGGVPVFDEFALDLLVVAIDFRQPLAARKPVLVSSHEYASVSR